MHGRLPNVGPRVSSRAGFATIAVAYLVLGAARCAVGQGDSASAGTPGSASQIPSTSAGRLPEVRLEAHDGKTNFMLGELIQLDLVFRNTTGEAYTVDTMDSNDLSERKIEITPASGWLQWQGPAGHDEISPVPLDAKDLRVPVVLNEGFVFREPGHYEVRVTTGRLGRGSGMNIEWSGEITTNTVGIDLTPMPEAVEAATVRNLLAEIASNNGGTREAYFAMEAAYARLAALQGDDALRAKIHLILEEDDEMRRVSNEALASTRNLALQLALLKAAWKDPKQEPIYDMPGALAETRGLMHGEMLPGWQMVMNLPRNDEARQRAAREHAEDMAELLASLPARTGENRASAAFYLMQDRSLRPAQLAVVKAATLQEFPGMDSTMQATLLESRWKEIRDPSLVPVLETMLDKNPVDQDAIGRLVELDPAGAKRYVIRAVCDTHFIVPLEKVTKLPDATLPEVDECLGNLLRKTSAESKDQFVWTTRAKLAARFGTAAIVPAVREGWRQHSKDPLGEGAVLALLLRYAPADAVDSMKANVKTGAAFNSQTFFAIDEVFKARHAAYPSELRAWLLELVKNGNEDMARAGAIELSLHGEPEDRAALEARLKVLREKRASNAAGGTIDVTKSAFAEGRDADVRLEADLVLDLRRSSVWFVNNAEAVELARGCASSDCIHIGDPRNPDMPFTEDEQ
jgi:hypothetical protein